MIGQRIRERKFETVMAYIASQSGPARSFVAPVVEMFASLATAWERSRIYTRTQRELNALSNRELADLGISRTMITRMAYEAAYGRDA